MKTPDVTKVQGGAAGVFVAIALAAPQAGYDGGHLDMLVAASAVVAIAAIIADAMIRRGRAAVLVVDDGEDAELHMLHGDDTEEE